MIHSQNPPLSFEVGANHLHGVLRADDIRRDTLVQLVQHWAEPKDRDVVLDALDELAAIVHSPAREGQLDAAIEQVEDVASMDTAHIEVGGHDMRRLLAEATEVERVTSRFQSPRPSLVEVPAQQDRRRSA